VSATGAQPNCTCRQCSTTGGCLAAIDPVTILRDLLEEVCALRMLQETRQRIDDGAPLSRAQVCRILGIDLKSTLQPLILAKKIRTVPWTRGEVRIPAAELRRIQRDGLPLLGEKPAPDVRRPPALRRHARDDGNVADAIRNIKIK